MPPADLVVVGLSHHSAPVEIRERVAFTDDQMPGVLSRATSLGGEGGEAMIISTCNRVELYLTGHEEQALRERVAAFLDEERALPQTIGPHLYSHSGEAAVRHLFRVAASLDSAVVGESQILGQMKGAYDAALKVGTIGQLLGQVVPRAFAAAKRVRTETAIARSSSSVASAAVDLARRIFGDLAGREVLVIGAGKMGELAARHLVAAGCGRLLVVNRTLSRGEALAQRMRETGAVAEAHPWESLFGLLARADLVLSSTGAVEPVLTREVIQKAMKARRGRWMCLLDIAVPRDVDPAAGQVENVYLYDVDALTRMVDDNLAGRRREAETAEQILVEEVARCQAGLRALGVVPTIRALRERFSAVAHAEAARAIAKMRDATDKDRHDVEMLADSIVNKLLHLPMTALKREAESVSLVSAVHVLFDLQGITPAEPAPTRLAPIDVADAAQAAAGGAQIAGNSSEKKQR